MKAICSREQLLKHVNIRHVERPNGNGDVPSNIAFVYSEFDESVVYMNVLWFLNSDLVTMLPLPFFCPHL